MEMLAKRPYQDVSTVKSQFEVVVVGGGIGGLFAANALIAHGIPVSVYEQAPALGEVGAGVFLTPNSVRQLHRVGLGPAVERWGARVGPDSRYFRHDGGPIAPVQVTDSSGWNATFGMHRADLVELLADVLPDNVVHTGHRCTGFEQRDDVARVSFSNGAVAEADVIVGADGIHSELRPYVFPPSNPVFSGSVAYRGVLQLERIPDWPADSWLMWLGKAKHFLTFPVRAGQLINYVGFVPADEQMKESWSSPGDPDVLRREFAGWDPRIRCFPISGKARTNPSKTGWRSQQSSRGPIARPCRPHLPPMNVSAASVSRKFSEARAKTVCATIRLTLISRCAMPRSPLTLHSAGSSTTTM